MEKKFKILAFAGSLRKNSYNKALIHSAVELAPENVLIEVFDLEGIPPYNDDNLSNPHSKIVEFKQKIQDADALLISSPEYNYSIPGVLKNAIDCASRPLKGNPLEGKPVAIMSASTGKLGGARAQYHLRQTFVFLNMQPVNRPEVMVSLAAESFDANGKLISEQTIKLVKQLLEALVAWANKLKCSSQQQNSI